jgi:hypothetical protein
VGKKIGGRRCMMEGKIKSALEKALERAASFREVPAEEIERMESLPRGRAIGAAFMNNEGYDIKGALADIPPGTKEYVVEGCQEVLLLNIALSADESLDASNHRAMEGIAAIKNDRKQIGGLLDEMNQLLGYYRQAIDQTRERFKQDFEMRSQMKRGLNPRGREQEMLEFREEWSKVVKQLNERFEAGLGELKDRIKAIS